MAATILDGRKFSAEIREELKCEVIRLKERGVIPGLAGIMVGEDPSSVTYIGLKAKACAEVGIRDTLIRLPDVVTEHELLSIINKLNTDSAIHGIFVQLPLPKRLSEEKALAAITSKKDVDGANAVNVGRAWLGQPAFVPAVAIAIQEMLARSCNLPHGKDVVIVNLDNLVGKPLASILIQDREKARANVTLCYPDSPDLASYTRRADILVVYVNKPKSITADMVKDGAIVIDCGTTMIEDPVTGKRRTLGDVDFESVREKASSISPVPGGVGPMLVTMLMMNTVRAAKLAAGLV
jgi:methylenetetrahydrofolate dehydrogenase (NADP+) / methenyltetrahydrofolate cyclohydrolase